MAKHRPHKTRKDWSQVQSRCVNTGWLKWLKKITSKRIRSSGMEDLPQQVKKIHDEWNYW
jgi:hypothetical protein